MKVASCAAVGTLMLLLLPGCATHHLWTESRFAEKHSATVQSHLEIYKMPSPPQFLAVYDEWNPHGLVRRKAYFLPGADARRFSKKPKFVAPALAQSGEIIPMLEGRPAAPLPNTT